jgi:hypothetical protein
MAFVGLHDIVQTFVRLGRNAYALVKVIVIVLENLEQCFFVVRTETMESCFAHQAV